MRIETREDALREVMHVLADHRQGKPVDFPQLLADLAEFLQNDKTVEELENQVVELENQVVDLMYQVDKLEDQVEELETQIEEQELSIARSDVEAIMEPLSWAQRDLEDFRRFIEDVKVDLPNYVVENIVIRLNVLRFDIDHAMDKVRILVG